MLGFEGGTGPDGILESRGRIKSVNRHLESKSLLTKENVEQGETFHILLRRFLGVEAI
jgi:hypothetical protein